MRIPLSEVKTIRCRRFNRLICAAQSTVRPAPEDWTFASLPIIAILLIVIPTIGLLAVYDYL